LVSPTRQYPGQITFADDTARIRVTEDIDGTAAAAMGIVYRDTWTIGTYGNLIAFTGLAETPNVRIRTTSGTSTYPMTDADTIAEAQGATDSTITQIEGVAVVSGVPLLPKDWGKIRSNDTKNIIISSGTQAVPLR
jgi:hypothetical protein